MAIPYNGNKLSHFLLIDGKGVVVWRLATYFLDSKR